MITAKEIDGELWIKASDHHQAIKEALAEHAMRETQRLGQEIEQKPYSVQQAYAMAKVCLDLHKAIGCKWGDNVYLAIVQLKAASQPPQRTWVGLTDDERSQLVTLHHGWNEYGQAIEAKLKQKNGYSEENT